MKRLPPPSGTLSFESESYFERFDELTEIAHEQVEAYQKLQRGPWFPGSSGDARLLAIDLAPTPEEDKVDTFQQLWPGENIYEPSHDFIVKRLGLLVGSFPSVNPHSPKVYLQMLVARAKAKHPSCMALESAANELVDTHKYATAPNIADLVELLVKHKKFWDDKYFWTDNAITSGRAKEQAEEVAAALERKEQEKVDYTIKGLIEHKHLELADKLKEGGWHMLEEVREEARKLDNEAKLLTHQHSHNGSNGKLEQKDYFKEFAPKEVASKRPTVQPLYSYSDVDNDDDDDDDEED